MRATGQDGVCKCLLARGHIDSASFCCYSLTLYMHTGHQTLAIDEQCADAMDVADDDDRDGRRLDNLYQVDSDAFHFVSGGDVDVDCAWKETEAPEDLSCCDGNPDANYY